jgi:LysR family transcriptional regulator, nitrogen assimilation regulatory protein
METFRDIRLFVAAYEERSFTAAAEREHATQSGVSQHIRKLEDSAGVRLFSRGGGMVIPTPAADLFYRRCVDVLKAHDAARRSLRQFRTGLEGEITVGLMPTMTRCALAPALSRFLAESPNVVIRPVEAYSAILTQQVLAGQLEFAIVPALPRMPGLASRLFAHTPEVFVSAPNAARKHLERVRLAACGPLKVIAPGPQNTRRRTLDTYFAANGIEIERLIEMDSMFATLDLISRSDWVTVLPGILMASPRDSEEFCAGPLIDPPLGLDLVVIQSAHKALSQAAEAFLFALEEETAKVNRLWTQS